SFVWFDSVNRVDSILRRSLYFSPFFGFVFRGIVGNGEIDPIRVRRFVPSVATNKLVSEVVERTHEILNGIAGDQCNAVWNRISASDVIDRLSRLRITLGPDLIRLSVQEGTML